MFVAVHGASLALCVLKGVVNALDAADQFYFKKTLSIFSIDCYVLEGTLDLVTVLKMP